MNTVKVKTAELEGAALDWAVAVADGKQAILWDECCGYGVGAPPECCCNPVIVVVVNQSNWSPSTDWSQGGPLLDLHCKSFGCVQDGKDTTWRSFGYGNGEPSHPNRQMRLASGPSILIAACRAIVAAKLGAEVEIPAELVT